MKYQVGLYNKTIFNQIYNIYPREYSKLKSYKINVLLIYSKRLSYKLKYKSNCFFFFNFIDIFSVMVRNAVTTRK